VAPHPGAKAGTNDHHEPLTKPSPRAGGWGTLWVPAGRPRIRSGTEYEIDADSQEGIRNSSDDF
jgi:hypothetical protein